MKSWPVFQLTIIFSLTSHNNLFSWRTKQQAYKNQWLFFLKQIWSVQSGHLPFTIFTEKLKKLPGSLKVNYIQPMLSFQKNMLTLTLSAPSSLRWCTYASPQPLFLVFPTHISPLRKKKKKKKMWNRGRIRELQARTFALVSFYNYPPGGKCLTFLVLIASFINEWGGLAILRFLLDQISHYENRLWILHQYLTLST